jgi:hypothetical protein
MDLSEFATRRVAIERAVSYEIPDHDADLWDCGVVLTSDRVADTRLFNMTRGASGREFMSARRAELSRRSGEASARARLSWMRYLMGRSFAKPYMGKTWAESRLVAARERWGDEEYNELRSRVLAEDPKWV